MKHFTPFLSAALVALWLLPQTIFADDCTFIPDLFPGQAADRTETIVSATVHVGEWGPQSGYDNTHLINSLASSNEDAVKVYSDGGYNAKVYFAAVGTADVTYTETDSRAVPACDGVAQTIHYTVAKGTPTIYFAGQDGMPTTEYTAAWSQSGGGVDGGVDEGGGGSYVWTPSYYARYQSLQDLGRGYQMVSMAIPVAELTFNSTNPAVASISESGVTTVNGYGTTVISVSWPGNANWEAGQGSYTLNVKKPANIYFSPSNITDTIDNVVKLNVVCPEGVSINRYQSLTPTYATVDDEGNVTLLKVGQVNIYAYSAENEEYASGLCACQINVVKRIPDIHFSSQYVEVEFGVTPYALPELIKPSDLNTSLYHWRLSNGNVAAINTNTGALDIFETGHVQVYYYSESNADPKYEPTAASYSLTVTSSGVYVNGTLVSTVNPNPLGDGSIIYSVDPGKGKFLTFNNLNYVGNGSNAFIEASAPLNILVKGNCSISNVPYAINATSSVFLWCENNKDTISFNAQYTAINAGSVKVHDCYLFATAGLYAISTQASISVSAGGYIFAEATGQNIGGKAGTPEAIQADFFVKGEDNIGGINVLTKGVTFHDAGEGGAAGTGGFFTNYAGNERATFVEIGKVPLPLPEDEVTEIDFEEDPHDNLDVVFSESENDQFNSTEKQIEINTITLTKDVNGAYTANVACSSEWLKLLPGVLVFDVPAGKGEAEIECDIAAGKQLIVYIEGQGQVTFTTTENGIKIAYNVAEQTHVIIYLQASEPSSAPKRVAQAKQDAVPGVAIKSIKITPESAATGIGLTTDDQQPTTGKLLHDGQLFIIRDGRIYNAQGLRVQ